MSGFDTRGYERLQARVTRAAWFEIEDHGMILVQVKFRHERGEQTFAPCFASKNRDELADAMALLLELRCRYKEGWTGYVFWEKQIIKGMQDLELDGGEVFLLREFIDAQRSLPSSRTVMPNGTFVRNVELGETGNVIAYLPERDAYRVAVLNTPEEDTWPRAACHAVTP